MITLRMYPVLLLLCLQLMSCSSDQTRTLAASIEQPISDVPSRRDLSRQMRAQGEVLVAYSGDSEALRAVAERFQDGRGRIRFRAVPDYELDRRALREKVVLALGAPSTNWISRELNHQLPFQIRKDAVHFSGKTYADSSMLLSLPLYPSPFNQDLPVSWISGLTDAAIAATLRSKLDEGWSPFGWNAGGYEIFQEGERVLLGFFQEHDWRPDPNLQFDFSIARDTVFESGHFRFLANGTRMPKEELQNMVEACESGASAIRAFTGEGKALAKINIHIYPSAEEKGLRLYNTDHSHIDAEKGNIHIVYNDIYQANHIGKENEWLLRQLLGPPQTIALERGLAVRFTSKWQMQGYEYWANCLFQSGNMPALSELLDNERFEDASNLIMEPLAASFVDFLLTTWGKETFLERYQTWHPTAAEVEGLEKDWQTDLARRIPDFEKVEWSKEKLPVLRGFNFSHEGYAIYNGYISRKAAESLGKMASLGSNAASIIPYSYIRDPQKPAPIPVSDRPGSENDESVINSIYAARKLGMTTILKPQIWLGGGSWPGDVEMQNEEDWQAFFGYYYDWIRHYAMMAEIHQVDMLVIGTEFAKATLAREADWVALIRKIRQLYSGKITYASNWGDEFENVGFWNELDYIGLDCYYPLSNSEKASYQDLEANFKKVLRKVEKVQQKYNKPLLFTEVGFRSIPAAWRQPHAHANGAGYNGEHQQMCYDVVMKNLAGKEWFQGLLFWKWPSYLESRGLENTDYYPIGKPAEATVVKWFEKMGE